MTLSGIPSRIIVVAGTYDGVLAGWDTTSHVDKEDGEDRKKKKKQKRKGGLLEMSFAMAAHEGSVRCLTISSWRDTFSKKLEDEKAKIQLSNPGLLLSGGFDEALRVFDLKKHAEAGESKTPQDLGTPTCACFAPPGDNPTHCLVGLTSGKIALYKKKDWSIAHVLGGGHSSDGTTTGEGVSCLAVHPTGKLALSAGVRDGKICLWDLMKGRLAFVHKVSSLSKRKERISSIAWSHDGTRYAFCHGKKLTARDAVSGEDLLDIELPSRTNEICFLKGGEENNLYFVACACDNGSLPVLAVGTTQNSEQDGTPIIRAVMAIEPVERNIVGDDRIKCIQSLRDGFLVVTANSGGVISVMDLSGAVQMILEESNDFIPDEDEENEDEELLAVDILDSVRVGSGARITNIACWSSGDAHINNRSDQEDQPDDENIPEKENSRDDQDHNSLDENNPSGDPTSKEYANRGEKRTLYNLTLNKERIKMDEEAVAKARGLIKQANKRQKRKKKKQKSAS